MPEELGEQEDASPELNVGNVGGDDDDNEFEEPLIDENLEQIEEPDEEETVPLDPTQNILSYYRNEGKGGAVFFTCINPDEPLGEYEVTKNVECPMDESDPEYL